MEEKAAVQPKVEIKQSPWREGFFGVLRWMGTLVRKFLVSTIMGFAITPFFDLLMWTFAKRVTKKQ